MNEDTKPTRPQTPTDANCYPAKSEFKSGQMRDFQPVYTFGKKAGTTTPGVARDVDKLWSPKGRSSRIK